MRDIGKPTVIVHNLPGTPEEAEWNRENVKVAIEKICSRVNGFETTITICYDGENKKK